MVPPPVRRSRGARAGAQPGGGPKARQAEATRERLIDTTIGVLHERSYQGATVFEVAKAAGLTPGALQHHFGSKAALMMEVTDAILRASGPEGVAWPDPSGPLPARCAGLVQALWQRAYEPPRFLAAWAVYFGSADEPELRSHVSQRRSALGDALHARFVQVLPELDLAPDSRPFVNLVLSALRGLAVARLFGADRTAEQAQLRLLADLMHDRCANAPAARPTPPSTPRSARR